LGGFSEGCASETATIEERKWQFGGTESGSFGVTKVVVLLIKSGTFDGKNGKKRG
jgi:hypothetical protein